MRRSRTGARQHAPMSPLLPLLTLAAWTFAAVVALSGINSLALAAEPAATEKPVAYSRCQRAGRRRAGRGQVHVQLPLPAVAGSARLVRRAGRPVAVLEAPPPGTFNYRDTRSYTPAEALDVLNGVLLTKGYTLVRRGRMLVLGESRRRHSAEPGARCAARGARRARRVRAHSRAVSRVEHVARGSGRRKSSRAGPAGQSRRRCRKHGKFKSPKRPAGCGRFARSSTPSSSPIWRRRACARFTLKYLSFEAAMPHSRQMLGIPAEAFSTPDGSLHITKDVIG